MLGTSRRNGSTFVGTNTHQYAQTLTEKKNPSRSDFFLKSEKLQSYSQLALVSAPRPFRNCREGLEKRLLGFQTSRHFPLFIYIYIYIFFFFARVTCHKEKFYCYFITIEQSTGHVQVKIVFSVHGSFLYKYFSVTDVHVYIKCLVLS